MASNGSIKLSLDLPQTPVLARAPNSRPGLTDEAVEGDEAFISNHRRQTSRLSKKHSRSRSSMSYQWAGTPPSQRSSECLPRTSQTWERRTDWSAITPTSAPAPVHTYGRSCQERGWEKKHSRIYSDSSIPPQSSFDEDLLGGLSPRPLLRGNMDMPTTPESEIGRAIG